MGRCLGPAEHAGKVISQWVMNQNGNVLPIQTLRKLREDEISCPASIKEREDVDAAIQKRHGMNVDVLLP